MDRAFQVLLADDDTPLRHSLVEFLSGWGWQVLPAESGSDALETALRHPVDFSILDFHMPGLSGLEVIRELRAKGQAIPSIVMSAGASREEAEEVRTAGAFTLIRKPFRLPDLRVTLDRLIETHFPPSGPSVQRGPAGN